jgi:2,3-dimethylmalate lyase
MTAARQLRTLLAKPGMIEAPGAHDVLAAQMVQAAGFELVYLGGLSVIASSFGLPDLGLVSMPELVEHARRVVEVLQIPVLCDLDDGGGNPLTIRRTVRQAEQAGVAAFHIEDIDASSGKHVDLFAADPIPGLGAALDFRKERILPLPDAVANIDAAVAARGNPDTVIVGRTDSLATLGLEEAIRRVAAYAEAGCDLVNITGLQNEDIAAVTKLVPVPLMNYSPHCSPKDKSAAAAAGLKIFFYPSLTFAPAVSAVWRQLTELRDNGAVDEADIAAQSAALSTAAHANGWFTWSRRR